MLFFKFNFPFESHFTSYLNFETIISGAFFHIAELKRCCRHYHPQSTNFLLLVFCSISIVWPLCFTLWISKIMPLCKWFRLVQICLVQFGLVWFGQVWFGLIWFGFVWFGIPGVLLKFHFLPALCLALRIPRGGLAAQGNGSQQTSLMFPLLVV